MPVECPLSSFTKPKRLPKKRNRPSNAAFGAAAAQLDLINRKSGGFRVPTIQDLSSDEEISPETEYRMVHFAAQKVLARQSGLAIEDQDEFEILSEGKDTSQVSRRQRRVVIDSNDEDSTPSARSSPPKRASPRHRSISPLTRNTKRRRDRFLCRLDSADRQSTRKLKKPRQDVAAELDDLHIDMEGWCASEDAPTRLRQRK